MADTQDRKIWIRGATALAVMDDQRTVLRDADLVVEGARVKAVGRRIAVDDADEIWDGSGKVILPGMVNTHHHLYQTLCRNIPRVQDSELFDWLRDLYEIWRHLTPQAIQVSAMTGMAELLLTGCTTTADHFYLFPMELPPDLLDRTVESARALGIRFTLCRGSMSRGKSKGGLPPDEVVQDHDTILKDSERVVAAFHEAGPLAMVQVALAPCSPFSVTTELLRDSAQLARSQSVRMHTHLCETMDEERYCLQKHNLRPLAYMQEVDWLGSDVWYAHGIYFNDEEIAELGRTRTGIAHCPSSNLRLGSGIAPVPKLRKAGVPVGLAVDGSASNDSSDMLAEARMALMVHRVGTGIQSMRAMDALWLATRGGAEVLGRDDIGSLEPGKAADFSMWDLDDVAFAGGLHDPVAALVFCNGRRRANKVVVHGQVVVNDGQLVRVDEHDLVVTHNRLAGQMVEQAAERTGIDYLCPRPTRRKT
jgi:cytosine/adenosine deaminase-related metal-dependent hydrolase